MKLYTRALSLSCLELKQKQIQSLKGGIGSFGLPDLYLRDRQLPQAETDLFRLEFDRVRTARLSAFPPFLNLEFS
jgi:hypothetical protein